jgi:hypothetical protein
MFKVTSVTPADMQAQADANTTVQAAFEGMEALAQKSNLTSPQLIQEYAAKRGVQ